MGAVGEGMGNVGATTLSFKAQTAWVFLPTLEGIFCGGLILAYEQVPLQFPAFVGRALSSIGNCSYSIYLLHPFVVVLAARAAHQFIYSGDSYYIETALGFMAFIAMWPISWASFRLIEEPFLQFRKRYVIVGDRATTPVAVSV